MHPTKSNSLIPILLTALTIMLLQACAGSGEKSTSRPDWVSGNSPEYAAERYLLGRGEGNNAGVAQDRARADLAKIFVVNIKVADVDKQQFTRVTEGDTAVARFSSQVERTIITSTDKIIKGVQIAEMWEDPETGYVHALAVLPRRQAATGIKQEIRRLDDLTGMSIEAAANAPNLLQQLGYARRAIMAQQQRLAQQKSLQVIDSSGRGVPAKWRLAELITDYEQLLPRVRIKPVINGDHSDTLATMLPAAISSAGFAVSDDGSDYTMEVSLDLADTFKKDGWFWGRGTLLVKLADRNNTVVGQQQWPIKVSAQEQHAVLLRAQHKVDEILRHKLRHTVIGFSAVDYSTQ